MKKLLCIILCLLMLTGCNIVTFSMDNLLTAPSIADDQAAISRALVDEVGDITPVYPKSGEYRSAFIVENIDSEAGKEALAFYLTDTQRGSVVAVAVLDQNENGEWQFVSSSNGLGDYIKSVIICRYPTVTDVIIGYGTTAYEESAVGIYRYAGSSLALLYAGNYSLLDRADIDNCGEEETIILEQTDTAVNVKAIKTTNGYNYTTNEYNLSTDALEISSLKFGKIDDESGDINGMYIDLIDDSGKAGTEIVYLRDGALVSPTTQDPYLLMLTRRLSHYRSVDYNGDGVIEIPVAAPFLGYYNSLASEAEYLTYWQVYNIDFGAFETYSFGYYDLDGDYAFNIPGEWLDSVSLRANSETGVVTFVEYDPTLALEDMQEILSLVAIQPSQEDEFLEQGFVSIAKLETVLYMYKIADDISDSLEITEDEIIGRFYYFNY